ncbi:MAG: DNA polymerase III subunit delta' [Hyphomicrobium zavarzinii]|uniref:DNA polymerase III subunit delta' n=1 Tax=Hyphomicrobium zavarzinii TaxID=48292 RepID=UPI001A53FCF9|nr:DNA polymerase III subunit delta' [Hyphomicrobium zavarzinii]MBL8847001.1 DNA polymerase III subunit delta' [Hyphomicrobium zavarzinii]
MARAPAVQEIEELPEADRLEGFPHPRATQRVYGHEAAEHMLEAAFASGRMHHAWLVAGAEGIGKATLAYRFARYVLADPAERTPGTLDVAPETRAFRQVLALSHPGLLVIRRAYDQKGKRFPASIPVDEVRRLKTFLGRTTDDDAWRVVIVDRADELNISAANALLKSLEEPPPRTVFLLISSAPGRLLVTIRSRVRTLDLAPLAEEPLRRAVTQAFAASGEEVSSGAPTPSEWERLARLSGGSVRRVLSLHAAKGLALHDRISAILSGLPTVDWGAVHALGDELSSQAADQRYELFFELLTDWVARLVNAEARGEGDPAEIALARRLIGPARLATWAGLWERVAADKAETAALNLDRKALILDVFTRLEAAART